MKRSLLSLFCFLLCLCLLVGCSYSHIAPTDDDTCIVGTVDDKEIYLDELRFITQTYKSTLISRYGEDIFDGEDSQKYIQMLKELVYSNITANSAILILCEQSFIGLGETVITQKVDETLSELVDELGGMGKYKTYLKENHLTDRLLRYNTEIEYLKKELKYVYIDDLNIIENDDEKLIDILLEKVISVRHIYIPYTDENALEAISQAQDLLDSGESFESVLSSYGRDSDMSATGKFIVDGYMDDDYEDIAFSMKAGQRSDILQLGNGYYIIERLKLDVSSVWLNFSYLKQLYQDYKFISIIDEAQRALTFEPNELCEEYINSLSN